MSKVASVRFRPVTFILYACITVLSTSFSSTAKESETSGLIPTDYFDFVFVADPQVSPDGKRILFTKTSANEDASGRHRHIYILDNEQAPRRFTQGNSDTSPRWSADGSRIAFLRPVDKKSQVFLMPANGGESVQLTESEDSISSFQWLADGERILLSIAASPDTELSGENHESSADELEADKRAEPDIVVVKDAKYMANGAGFLNDKRRHLYLFTIKDKSLEQLTSGDDYNIRSAQVSADGQFIVYAADKSGLEYDGAANQDIFRLDLATKVSEPLTEHPHTQSSPSLSPTSDKIAYLHTEAPFEQRDLWLMNADGSQATNLTEDFDRAASSAQFSASTNKLYFLASDSGAVKLFAADPDKTNVAAITPDNKTINHLALSSSGDFAYFTMEDSTHLPELYRLHLGSNELTPLTQFNSEFLAEKALSPAQALWFENEQGMQVQGFVHKPLDFDESKRYPLVLNIKGGPGGMWGHRWFHENQMYAAKGYAVAYVNYRGSSGYGIAHSQAVRLDYGGADYRDNMQFLDKVLSQHDWVNSEALYITGGSHGGFLTNWITTQSNRFKAAVTQRSVSSWISEAGTQEFTPMQMSEEFGGTLWTNFDYYWDRSPLQFADKVTTPTLIIHSDSDMITPIGQGQEWFYALKANDVPTEMVIFKGESHGLSRTGTPTNLVERLERILDWFARYAD